MVRDMLEMSPLHRKAALLASLFFLWAPGAGAEIQGAAEVPKILPPLSFAAGGKSEPLTLEALKGKVILLNFWATWCNPCVAEMPALDHLQQEYGERGLVVLPASQDLGGIPTVEGFYRDHHLDHLGIFLDPDMAQYQKLGVKALPTSYLIGRDGRVITAVEGAYDWNGQEMRQIIDHALGEEWRRKPLPPK